MSLKNLFKLITLILDTHTTYKELVEFLYGESPPADHNFLRYDYTPHIEKVALFGHTRKNSTLFSIIIPTHNRCELLLNTIDAFTKQKDISQSDFEVVIVDNGSKDKTEEKIKYFANNQKGLCITYIKMKKNYGADFARNVGVLHSTGNLLAFTDDDCIVPPDWLYQFKQEFETDTEIAGVSGFKIPKSTRDHLDVYHRYIMWGHFLRPHIRTKNLHPSHMRFGLTANACYRKSVFEKIGGFNFYFHHVGFYEFAIRAYKSDLPFMYNPVMVEHFTYLSFRIHIQKCLLQGWDWYLLHKIHPDIRVNPSSLYFVKRTLHTIRNIITAETSSYLFTKTFSDIVYFSFLSLVTNFCFWFGKYWVPLKTVNDTTS